MREYRDATARKTGAVNGLTPPGRECFENDTTKRDGRDRPGQQASGSPHSVYPRSPTLPTESKPQNQ